MPSKRAKSWKMLRAWLSEPLGQTLLNIESHKVQPFIKRLFGYHALLLGEPQFLKLMNHSPILHRIWVHPAIISDFEENQAQTSSQLQNTLNTQYPSQMQNGSPVQSRQDKLPILSDEIDLLCLAHCLENIQNPHEVLRESYRVLKSEGHLLILGFNPWSLWGIWRLMRRYIKPVPWDGQFITRSRLKDWLALLGFDLLKIDMCFFRPPINNETFLKKTQWLEWLGRFFWSFFGASYIILAQKRVLTLTAVKPAWAERRGLVPTRLIEPVARL